MAKHQYTPGQALRALLSRLERSDQSLAARVHIAIDAGIDVYEERPSEDRRRKSQFYRKRIAYTDEQALTVSLAVLKAHFYEMPQIANAAVAAFTETSIGGPKRLIDTEGSLFEVDDSKVVSAALVGVLKPVEIEIETEATQSKEERPNISMPIYEPGQIHEIGERLASLRALIDFNE